MRNNKTNGQLRDVENECEREHNVLDKNGVVYSRISSVTVNFGLPPTFPWREKSTACDNDR